MLGRFPASLVLLAHIAIVPCHAAKLLDDLTPAQRASVANGEQVLITKAVRHYPWPQLQIYQRTGVLPQQLMAVFFDYNQAYRYVPNCKVSRISRQISPVVCEVDYEVAVPILADEKYTARNSLSRLPGGGFAVHWKLLRATNIESSEGSLAVEPFEGGSVVRYTSLIKPASRAAALLRGIAINQMKETVDAILREAQTQKSETPSALAGKVSVMEAALDAAR